MFFPYWHLWKLQQTDSTWSFTKSFSSFMFRLIFTVIKFLCLCCLFQEPTPHYSMNIFAEFYLSDCMHIFIKILMSQGGLCLLF